MMNTALLPLLIFRQRSNKTSTFSSCIWKVDIPWCEIRARCAVVRIFLASLISVIAPLGSQLQPLFGLKEFKKKTSGLPRLKAKSAEHQ